MPPRLSFGLLAVLTSCSFTTAGSFEECKNDVDCGSSAACSKGFCLALPPGCRRETSAGTVDAFTQGDRIPIAALLALTARGVADNSEQQGLNAMRMALAEVNDRKGLKNRSFGLFVCNTDDLEAPLKAQTAWMVTNLGVPAIITSGSTQTTLATKDPVRLDAGTMIISATATDPALVSTFGTEGNVWRVSPPDTFQAKVLANLVKGDFPDAGVRVDVVYTSTDYGTGLANPLADNLRALGFTTFARPFNQDDSATQFLVVNGLNNDKPRATVVIAYPKEVRELITLARTFPSLTRAGGHRWYLADASKDPAVLFSEDGGAALTMTELDQAVGTAPAQGAGGGYTAFRDSFRTRYGTDPNSFAFTSHSYDAMWLVMLASASAQSGSGELTGPRLGQGMGKLSASGSFIQVRADMWTDASNILLQGLSINVEGASGPLDFNPATGTPAAPYEVWQVTDGGIRVLRLANP